MKSFTDISQSKKLTEILPIESADMWYAEVYEGKTDGWNFTVSDTPYYSLSLVKPSENNYSQNVVKDIPCWTLTALLDVMPHIQEFYPTIEKINDKFVCRYKDSGVWTNGTNPVDAAFEMIIKLKEQGVI